MSGIACRSLGCSPGFRISLPILSIKSAITIHSASPVFAPCPLSFSPFYCRYLGPVLSAKSPISSASGSPINVIKSGEEFSESLQKVKGVGSHAIYYFTAAWCGPCKFISPVLDELSCKYPDVTRYKIDIDEKELRDVLCNLRISSVPTFHFYKDGKKDRELVGADVRSLKDIMESLYGLNQS